MMLNNDFTIIKLIGKGAFGEVYLTSKEGSSIQYATKTIKKRIYAKNEKAKNYLENELALLKEINHPNIVKLIEIQETSDYYHIITEYCNGGDLSSSLEKYQKKNNKAFSEEIVQHIMRQLLSAINYLHEKKIFHRDLKTENILIHYDNEDDRLNNNIINGKIKLIDFGFARHFGEGENDIGKSALGTPLYMDPGIIQKFNQLDNYKDYTYDEKVDIWSLGIICYELLIGKNAFYSQTMAELLEKIRKGDYYLPKTLSKETISFINGMIQDKAENRLSAKKLLHHKFLKNNVNKFHQINLNEIKDNIKGSQIQINSKFNQSIWDIFGDGIGVSIMGLNGDEEEEDEKERKKLEEMIWKSYDEINIDDITIEPKLAPFIPGLLNLKKGNINWE